MARPRPVPPSHAFIAALAAEHGEALLKFLDRMRVPRQDADDLLQEVLQGAYAAQDRFDPKRCNVRTWLFAIAKNHVLTYWTRRRQRPEWPAEAIDSVSDDAPNSEVRLMTEGRHAVLRWLIEQIPEERRGIFVAHALLEMTIPEVAQAFSLNVSTTWARYRAALEDVKAAARRWQAEQRRKGHDEIPAVLLPLLEQVREHGTTAGAGLRAPRYPLARLAGRLSAAARGLSSGSVWRLGGVGLVVALGAFGPGDVQGVSADLRGPAEPGEIASASIVRPTPAPPPEEAPAPATPAVVETPPPAVVPRVAARTPRRSAAPAAEDEIRTESKLVNIAADAIRTGQRQEARRLLERHARDFPDGQLAPQRNELLRKLRGR